MGIAACLRPSGAPSNALAWRAHGTAKASPDQDAIQVSFSEYLFFTGFCGIVGAVGTRIAKGDDFPEPAKQGNYAATTGVAIQDGDQTGLESYQWQYECWATFDDASQANVTDYVDWSVRDGLGGSVDVISGSGLFTNLTTDSQPDLVQADLQGNASPHNNVAQSRDESVMCSNQPAARAGDSCRRTGITAG